MAGCRVLAAYKTYHHGLTDIMYTMKRREKDEFVNYTLGVSSLATFAAFFKSVMKSKLLLTMVLIGFAAAFGFLYYLLNLK